MFCNELIEDLSKPAKLIDHSKETLLKAAQSYISFVKSCETLQIF